MGKRYTDTDKYKKPFFRALPPNYKLLWDYLYHTCDHAGVWIVDFPIASAYIGAEVKEKEALNLFNEDEKRVHVFSKGKKWLLLQFNEFQYGVLNPRNNVHKSVIKILLQHKVLNEITDAKYTLKELEKKQLPEKPKKIKIPEEHIEEAETIEDKPKEKIVVEENSGRFYKIEDLKEYYKSKSKLVVAFCAISGLTENQLFNRLDKFEQHLKSQSRFQETWEEYTKWFKNWSRKQPKEEVAKQPTSNSDLWQ